MGRATPRKNASKSPAKAKEVKPQDDVEMEAENDVEMKEEYEPLYRFSIQQMSKAEKQKVIMNNNKARYLYRGTMYTRS